MTDIYINRKGITYEVNLSLYSRNDETDVWVAEVDDDVIYVEVAHDASITTVIKNVEYTFDQVRRYDEAKAGKMPPVVEETDQSSKLTGDVFDMLMSWFEDVAKESKALKEETDSLDPMVGFADEERKLYYGTIVEQLIYDLGFEGEDVQTIKVFPYSGQIEVFTNEGPEVFYFEKKVA